MDAEPISNNPHGSWNRAADQTARRKAVRESV